MVWHQRNKQRKSGSIDFIQIMHQHHNQIQGIKKESQQVQVRNSFMPQHRNTLMTEECKKSCEAAKSMKEKHWEKLKVEHV